MISKLVLLSNFLLTLAVPSLPPGAPLGRRQEFRRSPLNSLASSVTFPSSNWAGVVLNGGNSNGTINGVTGTFTVPTPSGTSGGFSISIGIDGHDQCPNILQAGIEVTLQGGVPSYQAWYEFYPRSGSFPTFNVTAGDNIRIYIASNSTIPTATVMFINLSEQQITSIGLVPLPGYSLCEQNAEWVLENYDYGNGSSFAALANFDQFIITNAVASGPQSSSYWPSSGSITNIIQDNYIYTFVSTEADNLLIQYY